LIRPSTQWDSQASHWRDEERSLATAEGDRVVVAAVCPLFVVHWENHALISYPRGYLSFLKLDASITFMFFT
jgi:hypothetical protein